MKNDPRSNVYHWPIALCLALSAAVFSAPVRAEVGLPPPAQHQNAGFPSDQALQRRGYDPKTGVWKVDVQNNGKPTVTKNGGNINGSQGKTVTVTGRYGETGTMNTTVNQRVGTSAIQKTANGVWVASSAANALSKNGSYVAAQLRAGNYQSAFEGSVLALADFGNNLFGGLPESIVNLGRSLGLVNNPSPQQFRDAAERFYAAQRQAEAEGNYQKAVANAAAKKAAEAAAKAKSAQEAAQLPPTKNENGKTKYRFFVRFKETALRMDDNGNWVDGCCEHIQWVSGYSDSPVGRYDDGNISNDKKINEIKLKIKGEDIFLNYKFKFTGEKDYYDILSTSVYDFDSKIPDEATKIPETNPKDLQINQQEMLDILKRMLENQQTNHVELMNQLAKMGVLNQSAEQSTFSPDTALSAPYTPQGSSTPQQTRFQMNQDGTVGVDYVPRPDLKPNSPEAPNKPEKTTPSRQESPDTPNAPNSPNSPTTPNDSNSQNKQNQNEKEKDFCQKNPNADQCIFGAKAEDIKLPEQTIDLNFKPENIFQTDGVCPQPKSVDLGAFGRVEFSYQTLCDFAAKIRPVLIMMTILTCAWFVYGALQDL